MGQRCWRQRFGEVQRGNPQPRRWLDFWRTTALLLFSYTKSRVRACNLNPTLGPYLCQRASRYVWSAHVQASVCTLLLHTLGLVSCVRQHATCQLSMQLFGSCLGFAVFKKNLFLLDGSEFTPAASPRTRGDIYVSFSFFVDEIYRRLLFFIGGRSVSA